MVCLSEDTFLPSSRVCDTMFSLNARIDFHFLWTSYLILWLRQESWTGVAAPADGRPRRENRIVEVKDDFSYFNPYEKEDEECEYNI